MSLGITCFAGSQVSSTKHGLLKKPIWWAIYRRNTRNNRLCRPRNNKNSTKCRMRLFHGTYPLPFSYNYNSLIISNMNVGILRIHEDYVTTIFILILLNGWWYQIFQTDRRNIKRNPSESRHWSFPSPAAAQQIILHYLLPCFYWGKWSIREFVKDLRTTSNITDVVHI